MQDRVGKGAAPLLARRLRGVDDAWGAGAGVKEEGEEGEDDEDAAA